MPRGIVLLAVCLLAAGPGAAQDREETPTFRALGRAQWVLVSADVVTTTVALHHGMRENNPLVRPIADHPVALVPVALGTTWLINWSTGRLYHGHPRWATALRVVAVSVEGTVVASNCYQLHLHFTRTWR